MTEKNLKLKIGDEVEFKLDIEGHGFVKEIVVERSMYQTSISYIVGPKGNSHERFHPMAHSHSKYGSVVYVDSYDIFAVNGEWV